MNTHVRVSAISIIPWQLVKARPPHGVRRVASRSAEVAGEAAGVRNDQTWRLLDGESIGGRKAIGKPGENHGKTRKPIGIMDVYPLVN